MKPMYTRVVIRAGLNFRMTLIEERKRKLPSSLVVCLVIAMSLWSSDSMGTVLKNLVNGPS